MRVLLLTQTTELGPSSRYRVYQLLPSLRQMGFCCEVSPGIDAATYEAIYLHGEGSRFAALRQVWQRRQADLERVGEFDVVFVQKGFFPGLYAGTEMAMA